MIASVVNFILIAAATARALGQANHVVISEVAPMGGSSTQFNAGEYIELYNPLYVDVTFGPNVQLISGNTSGTNAAEWQLSLAGKTIKGCGFLLVGDGGVTALTPDVLFPYEQENFVTQYVITGSHNWSSNAENSNNENTLIVQSNRIANLYLQELAARYAGAGGTDALTGVEKLEGGIVPSNFTLQQNYPNPSTPQPSFATS